MIVISIIIGLSVVIYAVWKEGIPDSLSHIAYIVPKWVFSLWMMLTGMTLMPSLMDALPDHQRFVGFLAVSGLACVAATPYYKEEHKTLHYAGGFLCALCSIVVAWMLCPWLLVSWLVYACVWPKELFWAEALVYVILIISLAI